jgi:hypothetical protein
MADRANGQASPHTKITKIEAVRKALAHFGKDAKPAQMQPWIKQTFGIDMSTDHISTSKGDILRKKAAKKKLTARDSAAPTPASPIGEGGRPATKLEAVQRALAALGQDAKPLALKSHVKKQFGIDISAEVARNYKKLLARRAAGKPAASTPAAQPTADQATARSAPTLPAAGSGGGISLSDIQAVKDLVGRVGADQLRALIDLFGK